jgi:hypothetical protein
MSLTITKLRIRKPAGENSARLRNSGWDSIDGGPSPAQPTNLLAVDTSEKTDPAVGLLLALQGKVILSDVHVELPQKLYEHREGDSSPDQEAHEWAE